MPANARKGARVADPGGLLNRSRTKSPTEGSNPSPSANQDGKEGPRGDEAARALWL